MEKERIVKCADCGRVLDEQTDRPVEHRDPCRACGSRMRQVELTIEDPLEFHDQGHFKAEDSQGKTFLKGKTGDDLHRQIGQWNQIEQVVDRRGYGSAKKK